MSVCVWVCLCMQKWIAFHTPAEVFYHSEMLSVPYAHAGADRSQAGPDHFSQPQRSHKGGHSVVALGDIFWVISRLILYFNKCLLHLQDKRLRPQIPLFENIWFYMHIVMYDTMFLMHTGSVTLRRKYCSCTYLKQMPGDQDEDICQFQHLSKV